MLPRVMIASPTKNDAHYLPRHLEAWKYSTYPRNRIRWVWIYGRSIDKTREILENYFKEEKWNHEIYPEPRFKNRTNNAIWIADVMNAFKEKYQDEDFVVIDDTDIIRFSPNLLTTLIEENLDIVAPFVWIDGTNQFFDTYVFRDLEGKKFPPFNAPFANSKEPIEVSSAGTLLVMKGKILKEINFENPVPNLQFCRNAKKKGYKVWVIPWVNIYHANVMRERSEIHYPLEYFVKRGILPKDILKKI